MLWGAGICGTRDGSCEPTLGLWTSSPASFWRGEVDGKDLGQVWRGFSREELHACAEELAGTPMFAPLANALPI